MKGPGIRGARCLSANGRTRPAASPSWSKLARSLPAGAGGEWRPWWAPSRVRHRTDSSCGEPAIARSLSRTYAAFSDCFFDESFQLRPGPRIVDDLIPARVVLLREQKFREVGYFRLLGWREGFADCKYFSRGVAHELNKPGKSSFFKPRFISSHGANRVSL